MEKRSKEISTGCVVSLVKAKWLAKKKPFCSGKTTKRVTNGAPSGFNYTSIRYEPKVVFSLFMMRIGSHV